MRCGNNTVASHVIWLREHKQTGDYCQLRRKLIPWTGTQRFDLSNLCGSSKDRLFLVGSGRERGEREGGKENKRRTRQTCHSRNIGPVNSQILRETWTEICVYFVAVHYNACKTSLTKPCNHQPTGKGEERRGEEGGTAPLLYPGRGEGKRSRVDEEEEEEEGEGVRLFSSPSKSINCRVFW